ncbi:hypothetical protein L218DRAFT_464655 [Marasmius fiardii PR-910]|nr:hypothetical protein L218DRAFT_464655 [Marasmius fiardii PR-910]
MRCGFTCNDHSNDLVWSANSLEPLSRSNHPPSVEEMGVLRREYEDLSKTIVSLDSQINLLQASMELIKQKRDHLHTRSGIYKTVLHPCRQLPNEILEIIFGLCVEEDMDINKRLDKEGINNSDDCPSTLDTKKSPWVLAQVSCRWRDLVLSLPHLWTAIDVNWNRGSNAPTLDPYIERRLSLNLQRSQNRPLFVSWNNDTCDRAALAIVFSRSLQWKNASIRTGKQGLMLLTPYSGAFPNLSTLRLHLEKGAWAIGDENGNTFSVFRDMPALRDFTFSGDSIAFRHLSTNIPFGQLTRFHLTGRDSDSGLERPDIQRTLPLLVNVEECTLIRFRLVGGLPTTLIHLRFLILATPDASSTNTLLESLTLPSLRTLSINVAVHSVPSVLRLLHRSSCRLEDLYLYFVGNDVMDVLKTEQVQTLRTCSITGLLAIEATHKTWRTVSDAVLDTLRLDPLDGSRSNILPHLSKLILGGAVKGWTEEVLVTMLASRRNIGQFPLRNVSALVSLALDPDSFSFGDARLTSQLKILIEGGLVVNDLGGKPIRVV